MRKFTETESRLDRGGSGLGGPVGSCCLMGAVSVWKGGKGGGGWWGWFYSLVNVLNATQLDT